jgi:hypothetical protein
MNGNHCSPHYFVRKSHTLYPSFLKAYGSKCPLITPIKGEQASISRLQPVDCTLADVSGRINQLIELFENTGVLRTATQDNVMRAATQSSPNYDPEDPCQCTYLVDKNMTRAYVEQLSPPPPTMADLVMMGVSSPTSTTTNNEHAILNDIVDNWDTYFNKQPTITILQFIDKYTELERSAHPTAGFTVFPQWPQ